MERTALDPVRVKSLYDRKSKRYDAQHALVTLKTDDAGRSLVVEHGVRPGDRVLDAGGGTGSTAIRAAHKVGPTGHVVVLDLSRGILDQAERKATDAGVAHRMEFVEGDMLALPFAAESFDAVLSTYSACPLYDPAAGVLELYRVLRRGGRLAVAHSVAPANKLVRTLATAIESIVWRIPSLSMGCRPVVTLPALQQAGAELLVQKRFGVPLWPFVFYVVGKPT